MTKDEFIMEVKKLGININENILSKLDIYCDYLLEYNEHTNLTAIRTKDEVYLKHFYDSLTITKVVDLTKEESLMDIGTGAGFPGLVLKIFFPNLHVILVDSNNKKVKFLREICQKIGVENIEIINDRAENLLSTYINKVDIVTARAVTNLPVLTELVTPFVKKEKYFIAMKGNAEAELNASLGAIKILNCKLDNVETFELYGNYGTRTLIKIKKLQETDIKDVRSYDKIIKKPLIKK